MLVSEIRQLPLLSDIDPAALTRTLTDNGMRVRRYAKGATVYHQHDRCTTLDIVLSGRLAAYSLSENGSAMTMFTFQKHSVIGANLLYGDQSAYPLNIYAVTPCRLLHITQPAVTEFLHNHGFVMRFIAALSVNAQGMNRKITMMTQRTLRENLLEYLAQQSAVQGTRYITLPVSKKQLADMLGVQRPSLFRELKRLKDEKILTVNNREITLIAP